jgi:hypothetical protein
MRRLAAIAILIVGFLAPASGAGPVGMFGGTVVRSAMHDPPGKWVYIKGRGRSVRRVEVSKARFEYAASIPRTARSAIPADDLKEGTLVQVAATQDKVGEWIAQSVLILRVPDQEVLRSRRPGAPSVNSTGTTKRHGFLMALYSSKAARNRSMSAFSR